LKPAKESEGEGRQGRRTADGQQPDIGGNKNSFAQGLDKNGQRIRPEHGDRRIRAVNLPVDEQSNSAFVVWFRGVAMEQGVQAGESHHRLQEQEDGEAQGREAPLRLS
jgi:hypothetical protein